MFWKKIVFFILLLACLTPFVSAPIALALGLILAFTIGNPYPEATRKDTKYLLQASVVLLGFGMDLTAIVRAEKTAFYSQLRRFSGR